MMMNRKQRRAEAKGRGIVAYRPPAPKPQEVISETVPDFSRVPLATMCQSIQMLINELHRRGVKIYDFDNKTKHVQQIQIIGKNVYFLAEEDNEK